MQVQEAYGTDLQSVSILEEISLLYMKVSKMKLL